MIWRTAVELGLRRAPSKGRPYLAGQVRTISTEDDVSGLVEKLKTRQLPIRVDFGNPTNIELLDATFDCLDNRVKSSSSWINRLRLSAGRHLAYFPPVTESSQLLEDGTDMLHAPDPSYKYRLWAGGTVQQYNTGDLRHDRKYALVEKIGNVKVRGEKVFVQIRRAVVAGGQFVNLRTFSGDREKSREIIDRVFGPTGLGQTTLDPLSTQPPTLPRAIMMEETRWLCFMQDRPPPPSVPTFPRPPPNDVFHQISMTTTPSMLFRFSALTFNAHAIHIDPEYTKNVYGFPDLLVHGPMTLYLLIYTARGVAQKANAESKVSDANPKVIQFRSIDYKNLDPIFVREPITIGSTKPIPLDEDSDDGTRMMTSTMWISKTTPDGLSSVCVTATVRFLVNARDEDRDPESPNKDKQKQEEQQKMKKTEEEEGKDETEANRDANINRKTNTNIRFRRVAPRPLSGETGVD